MNLKIEQSYEDAVANFLASVSGYTIFKGFDDENILTPRIEIEVGSVNFLETLDEVGSTLCEHAKFDLTLSVRVITNADEGVSRTEHNNGVGLVRQKFLRSADNFSVTNLPDHNVSCIRQEGSTQMIQGSGRVTQTDYAIRSSCLLVT